jgi:uncharacterized protein YybS (DUF2232 family)
MPKELPTSVEAKLDEIIVHLRKLDERDRMRMWGGYLRSGISIVSILFVIVSSWYVIAHGAELMKMVAEQAATAAGEYTKQQGNSMLDQLLNQTQKK